MNPLTLVKRIQNINAKEATLGISDEASWHAKYKDSAYVYVGGVPYELTEGDLLAVFAQSITTGFNWDIERLKSKYVALRKQYAMMKKLLEQDEFEWNEMTSVIVATDETWDKYIEEHPDCESLRITGCPLYNQLCIIFCPLEISVKCNGSKSSTPNAQSSSMFQDDPMTTESEEINDTADECFSFPGPASDSADSTADKAAAGHVKASVYGSVLLTVSVSLILCVLFS